VYLEHSSQWEVEKRWLDHLLKRELGKTGEKENWVTMALRKSVNVQGGTLRGIEQTGNQAIKIKSCRTKTWEKINGR